ncbi:hypothetical protein FRC0190_00799 [Corynebacterium rouxii]|uniref:Uncharacterized protein n=1 Tax=Corynebacterium rouxii TaxID=2719119 RepID=A0A6I8MEZ0_9CORY|nr:hypothetical protein FRC0190_00799 [Corynebacterium rouxii]
MFAAFTSQTVQIPGSEYAELGVAMSAADALAKKEHHKENKKHNTTAIALPLSTAPRLIRHNTQRKALPQNHTGDHRSSIKPQIQKPTG